MGRIVQMGAQRGSQKWLQIAVNSCPHVINNPLRASLGLPDEAAIQWKSPLVDDDYAEYQDEAFLDRLNFSCHKRSLADFWPARGPVWDGLARMSDGSALLVEAKAHLAEIDSPSTQAGKSSRARIAQALDEAKAHYGAPPESDWLTSYYQYTNRLTHLYFLREVNELPVFLAFVYFTNDAGWNDSADEPAYREKIQSVHESLGLLAHIDGVVDVFVDGRSVYG